MPQDGNNSASQSNDTHDVEMIDDDISVITPKTHPPGKSKVIIFVKNILLKYFYYFFYSSGKEKKKCSLTPHMMVSISFAILLVVNSFVFFWLPSSPVEHSTTST